ncbi:plasmid pRiA4b ORF-3 family protein [Atopococcus tabaci]|uniref:plasmid pRiA4b ORF-3 family protein n=1 Tax=Atopococcus tabaci TaxID=269774 RepID=UPI00041B9BB4|nr:plasmid pRiA4b ORF-3 family protein [Atopococcus tabaci]
MIYQLYVTLKNVGIPVWRRLQVDGSMTFQEFHQVLLVAFDWTGTHLHDFEIYKSSGKHIKHLRIGSAEDAEESEFYQMKQMESLKEEFTNELIFHDIVDDYLKNAARDHFHTAFNERNNGFGHLSCRQFPRTLDEETTLLSEWLKQKNDSVLFTYDFGENWSHVVVLEKVIEHDSFLPLPVCIDAENNTPDEDNRSGLILLNDDQESIVDAINSELHEGPPWRGAPVGEQ